MKTCEKFSPRLSTRVVRCSLSHRKKPALLVSRLGSGDLVPLTGSKFFPIIAPSTNACQSQVFLTQNPEVESGGADSRILLRFVRKLQFVAWQAPQPTNTPSHENVQSGSSPKLPNLLITPLHTTPNTTSSGQSPWSLSSGLFTLNPVPHAPRSPP